MDFRENQIFPRIGALKAENVSFKSFLVENQPWNTVAKIYLLGTLTGGIGVCPWFDYWFCQTDSVSIHSVF